jgi:hypothetical protein
LFEVCFDGERFLPFEGAGAVSAWRLEFHDAFRTVDLAAVDDVVLHLAYTARDGGRQLAAAASRAVVDYVRAVRDAGRPETGGGLFAVFDVARDFADEFAKAREPSPAGGTAAGPRTLKLAGLSGRLPVYARGTPADRLRTQDVLIATDVALAPGDVSVRQAGTVLAFSRADGLLGKGERAMSALHSTDGPVALKDWIVTVGDGILNVEEMLILVKYTMG